jgi:hypothetical protein
VPRSWRPPDTVTRNFPTVFLFLEYDVLAHSAYGLLVALPRDRVIGRKAAKSTVWAMEHATLMPVNRANGL